MRRLLLDFPGELAGLLGDPGAGGVCGAAGDVDAAATELDEEEDVDALERDGLDGEEIDREHALRPLPQERSPGKPAAATGGADAGLAEDLSTVVAETVSPSPLISPAIRWWPQRGFSRARRRTSSRISPPTGGRPARVAYVQRRATSRRCQRSSVVWVTRNEPQRERGSSRLAAASKIRSLGCSCGRPAWRRSTDSSCRRTTISSSLKLSERGRRSTSCSRQRNAR
jgi:hypothetical protein